MLELFEQLLLHLQQEVVVVLHLLRGVHHERAHQVGAVRLVADPHGTRDGTEVHVVLIAGRQKGPVKLFLGSFLFVTKLWIPRLLPDDAELEAVVASALDDGRITHLHRGRICTA